MHKRSYRHFYHLVDRSPWPLYIATDLLLLTLGFVLWMNYGYGIAILVGFLGLLVGMFFWLKDVVREATFAGFHTKVVRRGLRYGFYLFLVSEAFFFVSFFWAFLHSSLSPAVQIGGFWPPIELLSVLIKTFEVPFLNTMLLITSGFAVTWAMNSIILEDRKQSFDTMFAFFVTFVTAFLFIALQAYEYLESRYSFADGIYGSVFFIATGFHGLHVIIGTFYLLVHFIRYLLDNFTRVHLDGFKYAIWYWHFVDVIWLALFIIIYWWGNYSPFSSKDDIQILYTAITNLV
jgi:cytochrome c oxidase subunit 3